METKDRVLIALAVISGSSNPLRFDQVAWTEFGFSFDQWHGATAKNQLVGDLSPELALSLWKQRSEQYLAGILVGLIERPYPEPVIEEKPARSLADILFGIWNIRTKLRSYEVELDHRGITIQVKIEQPIAVELRADLLADMFNATITQIEDEFGVYLISKDTIDGVNFNRKFLSFAWTFRHRS